MSIPVATITGSCHYWFLPLLVPAITGSCHYWFLPLLVPAITGSCHYWFLPLLVPAITLLVPAITLLVPAITGSCEYLFKMSLDIRDPICLLNIIEYEKKKINFNVMYGETRLLTFMHKL